MYTALCVTYTKQAFWQKVGNERNSMCARGYIKAGKF